MPRPGDRRPVITDQAIEILADGGARALSHQAVDRSAGLSAGSCSYYFRTRKALISATIERIRHRSREAFEKSPGNGPPSPQVSVASVAKIMADELSRLVADRRSDALAVFALLPEIHDDVELRLQLSGCLFSGDLAMTVLVALGSGSPEEDAADVIAFLEGLLFDSLFGFRSRAGGSTRSLADSIAGLLKQVTAD